MCVCVCVFMCVWQTKVGLIELDIDLKSTFYFFKLSEMFVEKQLVETPFLVRKDNNSQYLKRERGD